MKTKRNVVVTGLGIVSSLGNGIEESRKGLREGKRKMGPPTVFEAKGKEICPVAEIDSSVKLEPLPEWLSDYDTRSARAGVLACKEAFSSSGISGVELQNLPLFVGTTAAGVTELESAWQEYKETGIVKDSWNFANQHLAGAVTRAIVKVFGISGGHTTISTACSSSANAILMAGMGVRHGLWDISAVLGVDTLSRMVYYGFKSLGLVSPFPVTPFDRNRSGLTLGEGAACLVLEGEEHAQSRGAKIFARLSGWGMTSDAHHMTAPDPEGKGIEKCIRNALNDANILPQDVQAINAHGTGTKQNDEVEGKVLGKIFGSGVPVTSTKSFTGHTLGGAGAVEAVFSILSITDSFVPPTVGTKDVPEELGIRVVKERGLEWKVKNVISTSFGFGGSNACLVFSKYEG